MNAELTSSLPPALPGAVVAAMGLLLCFAGARLFKMVLALVGFLTGALLGAAVGALLPGTTETVVLVAAAIGGAVLALAFGLAYVAGVLLLGALGGALLGGAASAGLDGALVKVAVVIGLGLVGAVVAWKVQRVMIALSTALVGSAAAVFGSLLLGLGQPAATAMVERLAGRGGVLWTDWVTLGAWVLLALTGLGVQLKRRPAAKE